MQCLYVAGTTTDCLLRKVQLKMQCLYVAGTTTDCLLRRGVHLWLKNAVFVLGLSA